MSDKEDTGIEQAPNEEREKLADLKKKRDEINRDLDVFHDKVKDGSFIEEFLQEEKWSENHYGRIQELDERIDKKRQIDQKGWRQVRIRSHSALTPSLA